MSAASVAELAALAPAPRALSAADLEAVLGAVDDGFYTYVLSALLIVL